MTASRFNSKTKVYSNYTKTSVFNFPVFNPAHLETTSLPRTTFSKNPDNDTRSDSLKRAKDKIYDIACLNGFTHFVTLTINDNLLDASSVDSVVKAFKSWLNNMRNRYGLVYIFVPEFHSNGKRIHFHGLVKGDLLLSESGHRDKSGRMIYHLDNWKYGFTTAVQLDENIERVAAYITKYITKDIKMIAGNFYFAGGKGLIREPETVYSNVDYYSFNGTEYKLPFSDWAKVKYRTDNIEEIE